MIELKGRSALITGGSRGIGFAIAEALASEGVNIALNSSSIENLKQAEKKLTQYGTKVVLCPGNLKDPETTANILNKTVQSFKGLDILINNAGIAIPKPIVDTTTEEWNLHMAVNATAPFILCREAVPYLSKSDVAVIINISSVVGTKGYVNQGAYTASKHALMGMTKVLAQEVHDDDIRVHVISPGGVATDMVARMRPDLDSSVLMSPEEIADIALFLIKHRGNAVIDEINVRRASNTPWK